MQIRDTACFFSCIIYRLLYCRGGGTVVIATRDRSFLSSPSSAQRDAFIHRLIGRPYSGVPGVYLLYADLTSLASVRNFAAELSARFPAIDCLICNAGVMAANWPHLTAEGYEIHFGVNHLGKMVDAL
jgi:NAD(P)-dependent dehydrogenase (short-subunit alcohol dehydrogenase family)